MLQTTELLNHIHQNADMGRDSLKHIMELSQNADFSDAVSGQLQEYENAYQTSGRMLKDMHAEIEEARPMSKAMANMVSRMKSMADPSTSKLAEMVIEGSTMGITKLTKQLHDYAGDDREVMDFAEKQIEIEQKNIETMKAFL